MADDTPTLENYQGKNVVIRPREVGVPGMGQVANVNDVAWTVFLSSTVGDLEEYRQEVQDALLKRAQVACFLSEDWINAYGPTVHKCRTELKKAGAYIGIFGYWYGSIPNGYQRSITHLEFSWALEKWGGDNSSPIAVLMPKCPSKAERKLKRKAAALVRKEKIAKREHANLIKSFHEEVTKTWHTVNWFKDEQELREQVIVICLQWRLGRPMDAANGTVQVIERNASARKLTDEELGLLGRQPQLDVFEKILNRAPLYPEVPAVALLIHGNEDAGQRVFLRQLLTRKKLRSGRPVQLGRPQLDQYDVKGLTRWVGESLGVLSKGIEAASPEELADLIHAELQNQQLCFGLDQVYRLSGGIACWHKKFWTPLYSRLTELNKQKRAPHRLIAVLVEYEDCSKSGAGVARRFSKTVTARDYSKMFMLPVLENISAGDLMDWFDDLEIPDDAGERRAALVNVALKNLRGVVDGTPLRVFDRLLQATLWQDGEQS